MVLLTTRKNEVFNKMKLLEAKGLNKSYQQGKVTNKILKSINLSVSKGDFLGIVGPSGSGKTTLLYCLGSLEKIDSGEIFYNGEDISKYDDGLIADFRQSEVGFIFQFYNLIPNLTAYENVLLAKIIHNNENIESVDEVLRVVGLENYKNYFPNEMSGGMQQRVAIARALVNKPKIIFADEPTGNLDTLKGKEIMDLLKELSNDNQVTIILVTHNDDYLKYCNRTLKLIDGELVDQ
jgi:putative ABC transport system ATP-binding protein